MRAANEGERRLAALTMTDEKHRSRALATGRTQLVARWTTTPSWGAVASCSPTSGTAHGPRAGLRPVRMGGVIVARGTHIGARQAVLPRRHPCYTIDVHTPLVYRRPVIFIETSLFTRQVLAHLPDEEYAAMQAALIRHPQAGVVIQGTGGLRKFRWKRPGAGKSGGVRVIYYWLCADRQIRLLMLYRKSRQDDLSAAEKAALKKVVEKWNG